MPPRNRSDSGTHNRWRWWQGGAALLLPALHGCATQTPAPSSAPSRLVTLPGVIAEIGAMAAAVLIFRTLIADIHREAEQRKPRDQASLLPLTGRWLQYLIAGLVTVAVTPFIFAILLGVSIAVAWALMLLVPGLRIPPFGP